MSLEQTRRRRQAVNTIHDIVSAMRAIAAGRIQSAQRALAASRSYEEIVRRSLAALVRGDPEVDLSFLPVGVVTAISGGEHIIGLPQSFSNIASNEIFGITLPVYMMLVVALISACPWSERPLTDAGVLEVMDLFELLAVSAGITVPA